jgi:Phosphoesterase family/Concanavalin A-like lectin/glucanases superfamily
MAAEPDNFCGKLGGGKRAVVRHYDDDSNLGRLSPASAVRPRRWRPLPLGLFAVGFLVVAAVWFGTARATVTTSTFRPVADSWVAQNRAGTNFGDGQALKVDGSPIQRSYLRFNLQGLFGTIRKATLRLNSTTASPVGYSVRPVADNSWGETTITYANAPAPGSTIAGSSGVFASGQWISVDVTSLVSSNGLLSVALTSTSGNGMSLNSREAGTSIAPQLVVETTTDVRPLNTSSPTIIGALTDGQLLTAQPGAWSGTPPISFAYQWRRCDTAGANCVNIAGAAASTYMLVAADVGSTLRVVVTASNDLASSATSAATAVVAAVGPANTAPPTIAGTAEQGRTLTASPGTWSGTTPITYAYQWRRCDSGGTTCSDITAAAAQSYALTSGDVGSTVRVAVTASNSTGSNTAASAQTGVIQPASVPPSNTSPPAISGTARDGQTLSANPGSWSGTQPISFTYQWRRCDTAGANCADVSSATSNSYLLTSNDVGSTIRVRVTASNSVGSSSATSAQTAVVTSASAAGPCGTSDTAPSTFQHVIWIWMENKSYNQIIGNTAAAPYTNSLASQCGLATNYRAVTHPSLPNYIAATSGDYWGIADDDPPAAHPLSVPSIYSQVKAVGSAWRDYEESAPGNCPLDSSGLYAVKHDPAPYYTNIRTDCGQWDVPMGTTSAGNFLSDLNANTLPSFSFVTPNMCNDTHDCSIATGDSWLQAWIPMITSSQAYQSGSTVLFLTYDEDDGSPTNQIVTIVVSPYTRVGTASGTAFTHYSLLKTTEQLLGISTYLGHAGDASTSSMRADFNLGSSAPTPPANTSLPTISGIAQEQQSLTADPGAWSGTQPISYAYQWRRCDSSGASCSNLAGATGSTYVLAPTDVGSTMRVVVTASNTAGSAVATSAQSLVVTAAPAAPSNTSLPTIAGIAQVGQTLTASQGAWSGTLPISFSYQWRRCDSSGASCVDIVPAAAQTYTLTAAEAGATVRVVVTASNSAGASSASSMQTAVVQAAPVAPSNTSLPTIAGSAQAGQTLTASPGTWSGTTPISFAYQWRTCDSTGASCADVAGATSSSYLLGSTDVGATIRVSVTASNSAGSSTATSAQTAQVAAAGGCAPRTSSYSNLVLGTLGVIGYWRLGEPSGTVACDSKGANNGSYQSGTTLGKPGALTNDPDTAVAFNGGSGFVQVPYSSSLNVGDVFTVEAWMKRGTLSNANSYVIASKQSNAWNLWLVDSFLVLRKSGVADVATSTVAIADTAWHQVAATKNGSTVKLYIDGNDVTGTVNNQTMQNNTNPLAIGQSSGASFFNGTIDEVAVYNVALTPSQISSRYAAR